MSAFNSITLVGRLTADPELKEFGGEKESKVVNFTIAVDRPGKDESGEKDTDFFRCFAWNKLAEIIHNYAEKGRLVLASGRLENRSYEKDGQKHTVSEIRCEQFQLLDSAKAKKEARAMPASESTYIKDMGKGEPPVGEDGLPLPF